MVLKVPKSQSQKSQEIFETFQGCAHHIVVRGSRRKVFLKYDEVKHDPDNNLMAYLYLENKTFINAHLLKENLAFVDNSIDFKYKSKFNTILNG